MRYRWGVLAVSAFLATAGSAHAEPGTGHAAGTQAASACGDPSTPPLLASWPDAQRKALDAAMARGMAAVAYDGCTLRVLEQCQVPGSYRFVRTERAEREQSLDDAKVRRTRLFEGYAGTDAQAAQGAHLTLRMQAVGTFDGSKALVLGTSLEGDCEGATHYVSSVSVGAHSIDLQAPGETRRLVGSGGERCTNDGPASAPSEGCDEKLMVELSAVRFVEPVAPRKHDRTACPDDEASVCALKCTTGNLSACTTLAWMVEQGESMPAMPARAAMLYRLACFGGQQIACNNLGMQFLEGRGVAADPQQAQALFKMACGGGYGPACGNLGTLHRDGRGTPRDPAEAVLLFERACDGLDAKSCGMLGRMLAQGLGAPRDLVKAGAALAKGCALREPHACNNLAAMMLEGEGAERNEAGAARLFSMACAAGLEPACRSEATLLASGLGVARDPKRAAELFARACESGLTDACAHFEALRAQAVEVMGDPAALLSTLKQGCGDGKAADCFALARLHERGLGVKQNPREALRLLRSACEGGAAGACESVVSTGGAASKQAASWLTPLCKKGQQTACTALGDVEAATGKDLTAAFARYEAACAAGELTACVRAGALLARKPQLPAARATGMLDKACRAGRAEGCATLASLYGDGRGVPKDEAKANAALTSACHVAHGPSCLTLAARFEGGPQRDPARAQSFYQRACHAGDAAACGKAKTLPAPPPPPDPVARAAAELGASSTDAEGTALATRNPSDKAEQP